MRSAKILLRKLLSRKEEAERSNIFRFLLVPALLLAHLLSFGQYSHTLGLAVYQGGMFKQLKEQPIITFAGLRMAELRYTRHTSGKAPWTGYHNYPRFEAGINYLNYGMPDIFGEFITVMTGLNYPLIGERMRWSPGFGLGYSTRYNTAENRRNKAVSTKISFAVELDFIYEIPLSDKKLLEFVIGFRHASNGNIKKPNYGMNVMVAGLAVHHDFGSGDHEKIIQDDHEDLRKFRYYLVYATGWKDPRVFRDNPLYQVQVLSAYSAYRFSNINSFTLGFDGFMDSSQYEEYINQKEENPPFDEDFDQKQLAFTFGNTFHYDDLSIVMMAGVFLYQPYKFRPFSYQRYGFQYTLADQVVLHAALKAYFGSADAMEFGVGIKI